MSGYLEVKYPFRSNLGLNPFKAWKRQWCILRPSPICVGGGSLVFYCNEAGDAAGSVEIPVGSIVKKSKSRSRPYAFAVFLADEPRKPKILLAAQSNNEAQNWMDKIKTILEMNSLDSEILIKDTYSITMKESELSRQLSLNDVDGSLSITPTGLVISKQSQGGTLVHWKHVKGVSLEDGLDMNKICVIRVDGLEGGGDLRVSSPVSVDLERRLRTILGSNLGDTPSNTIQSTQIIDNAQADPTRPSSSLNVDCVDGSQPTRPNINVLNDSITSRRSEVSLTSLASGIYEEIPDLPPIGAEKKPGPVNAKGRQECLPAVQEGTYEAIFDVHCTAYPPPLPPRTPFSNVKVGESWSSRLNQISSSSRHGSLCSLPSDPRYRTLPKDKKSFTMFRKRLKSDPSKPTSTKENEDNKKKKFDFTQTAVFKNFRVGKKTKNKTNSLNRVNESKSCEFLDEVVNRCSKSADCLDKSDDLDCTDLSIDSTDDVMASLTLPQEIVDIILRSRQAEIKVQPIESDYMPMSPIIPPDPNENHYIVMSPRTNTI